MSTTYPDVDCTFDCNNDAYDESDVYMAGRQARIGIYMSEAQFLIADKLISDLYKRYTDCIGATTVFHDETYKRIEVRFEDRSRDVIVNVFNEGN